MSEILEKVGLKTCTKCEQTLPVSAFGKNKNFKDGLRSVCKVCRNKHNNQWRDENREHVNNYHREYCREYNQDPENNRKYWVRKITNYAIARRELIRPDACPQCGANDQTVQAHHWSYELGDELDVIWLCPRCHKALHQRNKID